VYAQHGDQSRNRDGRVASPRACASHTGVTQTGSHTP